MDSENYDAAVQHYRNALSLNPEDFIEILLKQSKARAMMGSWAEALIDADKACTAFHVMPNISHQLRYSGY